MEVLVCCCCCCYFLLLLSLFTRERFLKLGLITPFIESTALYGLTACKNNPQLPCVEEIAAKLEVAKDGAERMKILQDWWYDGTNVNWRNYKLDSRMHDGTLVMEQDLADCGWSRACKVNVSETYRENAIKWGYMMLDKKLESPPQTPEETSYKGEEREDVIVVV